MIDINEIPRGEILSDFEVDEQIGRMFFAGWASSNDDVEITMFNKQRYGVWDVAYTSGGTKCIGEIKFRRKYPSTQYHDWVIEAHKYNELKTISNKRSDIKIHYINIYRDYEMAIWDLTDMEMGCAQDELFPATSSETTHDRIQSNYYVYNKDIIYKTND